MSYQAKPIYLSNPVRSITEVRSAVDSFQNYWLTLHSSTKPLVLYHYTTLDGLQGIVKNRSIWCSDISSLNDPLELQYGKRLVVERLDEVIKKESDKIIVRMLEVVKSLVEQFDKAFQYRPYVACFCECDNLLSQWRAYATGGGGYILGISFDNNTSSCDASDNLSDESYLLLRKVVYDPDEQRKLIARYISEITQGAKDAIKMWVQQPEAEVGWLIYQAATESVNILWDIILSLKHQAFSEEKEWRLIKIMAENHKSGLVKFRETNGELVPYRETFIFERLNNTLKFPLRIIRIGPMLDEAKNKFALKLLLNNKALAPNPIEIDPTTVEILGAGYFIRK